MDISIFLTKEKTQMIDAEKLTEPLSLPFKTLIFLAR